MIPIINSMAAAGIVSLPGMMTGQILAGSPPMQAVAYQIVVMFQGRVVEQGMKSEILSPPFPAYTQLLLSSVPEMDPDWLSNLLDERAGSGALSASGN